MSKVRNLPAKSTLDPNDLFYIIDSTSGSNAGRKITTANVKSAISLTAAEVKSLYESNTNTNAFTDAEKTKLAGIEAGATADQNAEEVPYDNSDSQLSSTNVKTALDEVDAKAAGGFNVNVESGLIVHYTGGRIRVENSIFEVLAGDILLSPNITLAELYVDVDGIVKQTGSGQKTPPGAYPIAGFSTNLTSVIALTDARVRTNQNLVKAQLADVTSVSPNGVAAIGATNRYADAAHKHNIPTASAVGLDANSSSAEGNADAVARANHTHAIATAAPATQNADQANNAGSSAALAKADHIHNIPTAAASGLNANSTSTQGSANTFAKSDHTHAIASGAPSTQNADQANAAGSSANFAKADHVHNIPTAAPSNTGTANAQGTANTFAKSDHVHNTVVANSSAVATADATSVSTTDVLIAGMTLTPAAGTYLALFDSSVVNSGNGATRLFVSLYAGGAQIAHSERTIGISGGANTTASSQAVITVNGSQAIEARWRAVAGTNTAHQRSLILIRLGP